MNTDRDNFHDWARDKPDTAFNVLPIDARRAQELADQRSPRWGRLAIFVVLAVALVAGFKILAGL